MAHVVIDIATSGVNAIVAAPAANQQIRVLSYFLVAAGAVTAQWKSATTAKTGAMSMITGVPLSPPIGPMVVAGRAAHFICEVGDALNLVLGGAVQVSGHLEYELRTV